MPHSTSPWPRRLAIVVILLLILVVAVSRLLPRAGSLPTSTPFPPVGTSQYTSPGLHVTLTYPSTWQPSGADRFSGPDGFVEMQMAPSLDNLPLTQACRQEAAHTERYGAQPQMQFGEFAPGLPVCFIQTSSDPAQGKTSALIISIPGSGVPVIFFTLRSDPSHFEQIWRSLKLPSGLPIPAAPTPFY